LAAGRTATPPGHEADAPAPPGFADLPAEPAIVDAQFLQALDVGYRSGDAARYLDQVRGRVTTRSPDGGKGIKVASQRFAGQDALLIEVNYGNGFTARHVLVRQGV
jgi:hypothetical protein